MLPREFIDLARTNQWLGVECHTLKGERQVKVNLLHSCEVITDFLLLFPELTTNTV
jgi:hypothetical protein